MELYNLLKLDRSLVGSIYADKVHYRAVTGSTNNDARDAARAGAPHGSVYLADEQTAGRGRSDHTWESSASDGLYVSVLLRPALDPQLLQWLPLAAGLAAANAMKEVAALDVDLRWPNDLLIGSLKVGGILVEAKLMSASSVARVDSVVIGIGINVHQRGFADGLEATSVDLEVEKKTSLFQNKIDKKTSINRQELLICLLKNLQNEANLLPSKDGRKSIRSRLEATSTWLQQRAVEVHGPQACVGLTMGLDELGMLLVQTESGLLTVQTGGIRALAR